MVILSRSDFKSWNFRPLILTILGSGLNTIIMKIKSFLESSSNCLATKIWYWSLLIILKPIFKAKNRAQSLIWWLILQITVPLVFVGLFFWPRYLFKWVTLTWSFKWLIEYSIFGQTGHLSRLLTRSCFLLKCTAKSTKSSNFSSHFAQELSVKSEFLAFSSLESRFMVSFMVE